MVIYVVCWGVIIFTIGFWLGFFCAPSDNRDAKRYAWLRNSVSFGAVNLRATRYVYRFTQLDVLCDNEGQLSHEDIIIFAADRERDEVTA